MKQRYSKILILFLLVLVASNAFAQQIKGVVTDSVTHEPLMYISVYYQEKRDMGTITNIERGCRETSKGEIFPQEQSGSGIHEEGNRTQKSASTRSERVLSVRQVREDENVHQRPHTGKARKRYLQEIFILKRSGGSVGNNQ